MERERTSILVGADSVEILNRAHILIVGLGGVGGWALRCWRVPVGEMTLSMPTW